MSKKILKAAVKIAIVLLVISVVFLTCLVFYTTRNSINTVSYDAHVSSQAKILLVFLPGLVDIPDDFVKEGFVKIVKDHSFSADVFITDAHIGYYVRQSLIERLKNDVINPAKDMGYRDIWLVGFSMGGFGSLLYAWKEPDSVKGVLALAPYLGSSDIIDEIFISGGLDKWKGEETFFELDFRRPLWIWLKEYSKSPERYPTIFLGYSMDDERINKSNNLLADALPEEHIFKVYGGHEWEPWRQIFSMFIESIKPIGERAKKNHNSIQL